MNLSVILYFLNATIKCRHQRSTSKPLRATALTPSLSYIHFLSNSGDVYGKLKEIQQSLKHKRNMSMNMIV